LEVRGRGRGSVKQLLESKWSKGRKRGVIKDGYKKSKPSIKRKGGIRGKGRWAAQLDLLCIRFQTDVIRGNTTEEKEARWWN